VNKVDKVVRLTKGFIIDYLRNVKHISRDQFINDLQLIGLKMKGCSPDMKFMEFVNQRGQVRVKLHPADKITNYSHIHILDSSGKSLNRNLRQVNHKSIEAHIAIKQEL